MRTMTISLPAQQADRVQRAVQTGDYASDSDVMREALRMWEEREDKRASDLDRLKLAYEEGMTSGESRKISPEDLLTDFKGRTAHRG